MDDTGNAVPGKTQPSMEVTIGGESPLLPAQDSPPSRWPTNLKLANPEDRSSLLKMSGPPDSNVAESRDTEVSVVGWLIRPASSVDEETGEVSNFHQLCLLTVGGDTVGTSGQLFIRKWLLAVAMCGQPDPLHPIRIVPRKRQSRRQGRVYDDFDLSVEQGR